MKVFKDLFNECLHPPRCYRYIKKGQNVLWVHIIQSPV